MPGMNSLSRFLCRHVLHHDPNDMPGTQACAAERDGRMQLELPGTRDESGPFALICEFIKEYLLQTQSRNAQAWLNALQMERRARRRSLCLLMRQLNEKQRREFRESRHFHVIGGSTGVRYRIRFDPFSNIDVLYPNGTVKHQLCVQPTGDVPVYDKMAAQLLYLQDPVAEMRLLRKANILPARAGQYMSPGIATRH